MRSRLFRFSFLALVTLSVQLASADIHYRVTVQPAEKRLFVEITAPVQPNKAVMFEIPRWAPGSYRYQDFAGGISAVQGSTPDGTALPVSNDKGKTQWTVMPGNAKEVKLSYFVKAEVDDKVSHWSGPATYMYLPDRKEEDCVLEVRSPLGPTIVGLEPKGKSGNEFGAPDYDVLADNPVTTGQFLSDTYMVSGKPHFISIRGANQAEVDREYLKKLCEHVTRAQENFFGGLPYKRYVWHFTTIDARDGGWGLEHLTSTQIGLSTGLRLGVQGVISHEFFHLWNVKRIRSAPLGPFNYQELPQTGALWWLEGVTDYYAKLLLRRYGWIEDRDLYDSFARTVASVQNDADRNKISAHEASYRVRDANNGQGNSRGYLIDYYATGLVAGMCLDIELRSLTQGKRTLDDVTRALYAQTKDGKPGFAEDEIRKLLVKFGGESMGAFYDRLIMQPGDLPVADQLAKAGLRLAEREEVVADFDISVSASRSKGGLEVRSATGAAEAFVKKDDLIVAIDGESMQGLSLRRIQELMDKRLTRATPGSKVTLTINREGAALPISVELTSKEGKRTIRTFETIEGADKAAVLLRQAWFTPPANWKG